MNAWTESVLSIAEAYANYRASMKGGYWYYLYFRVYDHLQGEE